MSVSRIEALCDGIARINSFGNPESEVYQLRNPLKLKSYGRPGRHDITAEGLRIFGSSLAGLKAALFDLEIKLKGLSRAGLKATDPLRNLLGCYGLHEKAAIDNVVAFVRRATKDESINAFTPLSYFLEDLNSRKRKSYYGEGE